MNRVDEGATAFGHRRRPYNLLVTSIWDRPAESDANIRWTREFFDAMQAFLADGVYGNYRLVALKNTYDPTNFFRLNQNIGPTARRNLMKR